MTKNIISEVYNKDCVAGMREYPDKYFDLAIVDPPYGIGAGSVNFKNGTSKTAKDYYKINDWDLNIPDAEYFLELFRVSKNQIIWGGNYMTDHLPPSRCWIFWDKTIHGNSYADGELAWTSFDKVIRYYRQNICQIEVEGFRIHPTQKAIKLYDWILLNYAKEGDKILDTHLGSGSSRIAAYRNGFHFVGFELDKDYYEAQEKRFKTELMQPRLF